VTGADGVTGAEGAGAVIFDLDGVLVDSEIWWDEVRRDFAAAHGRQWTIADREAVMGANSAQWSRTMRERLKLDVAPEDILRAVVDGMVERYRRESAPSIEGVVDAVRAIAARHPVAVASSAHRDVISAALHATGLEEAFAVVVSSDEVAHGKPRPDVYLEAAKRLGASPRDVVVIEDSLNGVRAAREAGMRVVLVPNRSIPPAPGTAQLADLVVDRLADLDPRTLRIRENGATRRPELAGGLGGSRAPRFGRLRATVRYGLSRIVVLLAVRAYLRLRIESLERLPTGPAVLCFNHLNWIDPFVLMAALPARPRLYFFGPREADMSVGGRNRLMAWSGAAVPYKPGNHDLLGATRRVRAVFDAGGVLAIAGEGRIHVGESRVLPLNEGAAYFALRAGVPIVPVAINGTSWLRLGRVVRVRIGEPLVGAGRPTREAIAALTDQTGQALSALVADHPDYRPPGRLGRWLTELFNDWPEGSRPATPSRDGARPRRV
jgi:HAD superfamily hydrolase (TIGR01509 family)